MDGGKGAASWAFLSSVSLSYIIINLNNTSLGNDGALANEEDGPVEFALHVFNDLLANFSVGRQRTEWDIDKEVLAKLSVELLVFVKSCISDKDLLQEVFNVSIVHFELQKTFGSFIFQIGGLGLK